MAKRNSERENPIEAQIARLNQLEKLIPSNEDIGKYGLEAEEMESVRLLFGNFLCDVTPHIQLAVTVLRKRKDEKPNRLLRFKDLSEFLALMTEDEHGTITKAFLREMRELGGIKVNRHERVSIKI